MHDTLDAIFVLISRCCNSINFSNTSFIAKSVEAVRSVYGLNSASGDSFLVFIRASLFCFYLFFSGLPCTGCLVVTLSMVDGNCY